LLKQATAEQAAAVVVVAASLAAWATQREVVRFVAEQNLVKWVITIIAGQATDRIVAVAADHLKSVEFAGTIAAAVAESIVAEAAAKDIVMKKAILAVDNPFGAAFHLAE
jgi:hypothetical protein